MTPASGYVRGVNQCIYNSCICTYHTGIRAFHNHEKAGMGGATASDFRGAMRALASAVSIVFLTSYTVGLADGVDWVIPIAG